MTPKSLLTAGALITIGMVAGRLLGLLREMLLAAQFGTGPTANMAIALLIIPDFITSALIGSAVSATLVPAFSTRTHERAIALFWQALLTSVAFFAVVALLVFSQHVRLAVLFSDDGTLTNVSSALFLTLCALPLTAATAVITAYLQYRERFRIPAFANTIFNSVLILMLWLLPGGLAMLALAILAAALARLAAHLIAFLRAGNTLRKPSLRPWQLKRPLLKAYSHTVGNGMFSMLPQYVPYAMVAAAGSGMALFNYAFKLVLMPAMLAQTMVQMLLLPWFVKLRQTTDMPSQMRFYSIALQLSWIVAFVMCMALSVAAPAIAALCFGHGKMTDADIAQVGRLFATGVWAMPGMLLTSVWQQIFYANEQTRMPFYASILQAALVLPLCWVGQEMKDSEGIIMAYAALQLLPVLVLAWQGCKLGMIRHYLPSGVYIHMTVVAIFSFIPMAALLQHWSLPPLLTLLMAGLMGMLSLGAGFRVCQPVRSWIIQGIELAWARTQQE